LPPSSPAPRLLARLQPAYAVEIVSPFSASYMEA